MAREKIHVGLEIGTTKVCAVVVESRKDGEIRLLGVGESPSRGVRKGEIVDFQNATKCVHDALADAEDRSDLDIKKVWVAVTGSHIEAFNNRSSVTVEDEAEITDEDVQSVNQKAKDEANIPKDNDILHALTFAFGLLLLVIFGWYFATDLGLRKRWLGLVLSVLLTSFCI